MLQQRQFLEGRRDVGGNHAASASTRSAALTPERRWAASTVSLPRVAVGATVGRGVGDTVGLGVVTMTVRTAAAIAA